MSSAYSCTPAISNDELAVSSHLWTVLFSVPSVLYDPTTVCFFESTIYCKALSVRTVRLALIFGKIAVYVIIRYLHILLH